MPASRSNRAQHYPEGEEAIKRPTTDGDHDHAPNAESEAGEQPGLPDLTGAPVTPEAWLSLQQSIGNSAVGGLVKRRRAGQGLPPSARHDMEASFGRNFGDVQVHTGPEVDQAAQALQAGAFAVGNDIYVDSGVPDFEDPLGRQVLGEELAHVAQGAGREGASRVTSPEETAERQAHRSGVAAAVGRPSRVSAAPEAAGAVARFSLAELEEEAQKRLGLGGQSQVEKAESGSLSKVAEAAGQVTAAAGAKTVEKTDLSDEEKDRLASGALYPLKSLWAQLNEIAQGAKDGKPAVKELQTLADNSMDLGQFIYSFSGPAAIQDSLEQAAVSARSGRNALLAAIDPQRTLLQVADRMTATAAEINGLAEPAVAPAAGAAAPEGTAAAGLSQAEADQLNLGTANPLTGASEQLKNPDCELWAIIDRLVNVPAVLRSFSKPAALVPQLHRKAMDVEVYLRTLVAVNNGAKAAVAQAADLWQSAILTLQGLTAKSPAGGVVTLPEIVITGADAGDDDKNGTN